MKLKLSDATQIGDGTWAELKELKELAMLDKYEYPSGMDKYLLKSLIAA